MSKDTQLIRNIDNSKALDKPKPLNEQLQTNYDPSSVLKRAQAKLDKVKGKNEDEYEGKTNAEDDLFKAMTLSEFKNGALLVTTVPEQYKTFAIDLSRKIQEEYGCTTISEKATAELAASNYIRTLEVQHRLNNYLSLGTITDTGVRFLAIMSTELDRANRHYLATIQALRVIKQPQLEVNIKANTAIIGQNQMVQANNLPNDP